MRVTPQRSYIWRTLTERGGHFTAEEVWDEVKRKLPGIELSTVYRALETLREAGLVSDSRLPEGPRVFEAHPSLHPHMVCESCGEISHPEPEAARRLFGALSDEAGGFEIHELHVVARGVCAKCARRETNDS